MKQLFHQFRFFLLRKSYSDLNIAKYHTCTTICYFVQFQHSHHKKFLFSRCYSSVRMNIELAKKAAAVKAVDTYCADHQVIGIGSGSTVVYAAERLGERVKKENLKVVCIPTSFQSRQLILHNGLQLGDLETHYKIDVVIDGADEVDANKTLIKGGGGCLTQEKVVASCTDTLIIIADASKQSTFLGEKWKKGIPIEVLPMAYMPVMKKIENTYGGSIELRMGKEKAGPVVTDNGNFIVDWKFPQETFVWEPIHYELKLIPGVVETGLFCKMAKKAFFGQDDGTVTEI